MRRSLLVRWLALTLTIALGSIVATAALATYGTTEQLRQQSPDAASLVETDAAILRELNRYASTHESWKGVEKTVRELADRYGRRIALRNPDGTVLADSHRVKLPSNAVATVDAASEAANQTARNVTSDGLTSTMHATTEYAVAGETAARWTEESVQQTEVCVRDNDELVEGMVLAGGMPLAVRQAEPVRSGTREKDFEREQGERSAKERGEENELEWTKGSELEKLEDVEPRDQTMVAQLEVTEGTTIELLDLSGDPCLPADLKASTARNQKIDERQRAFLRRCLDRAGIDYAEEPRSLGAATIEVTEQVDERKVQDCSRQSTEQALQGYVAPPALLYLGTSDRFDAFSAEGFWRVATMAFAVLLAAALVTVLAGRRMVRPIQALTGAAQRMSAGDHGARVPESGRDEVARMGAAFNQMAESVQEGERQRKAMVSDVAHELRNPLANVRGYLEAVEDGVVELNSELVVSLQEEARLLDRLVDDLQDLALADAGELRLHPQRCELAELSGQVVTGYQAQADSAGVTLRLHTEDATDGGVLVDPARMRQALGNLVANALAYTSRGGRVVVEARGRSVSVADTGTGIAAEHLPHLFDRFYRADSSRSRRTGGSGLGLAITRHLVGAHGGTIAVDSTVGEGTTFTIRLPAAD